MGAETAFIAIVGGIASFIGWVLIIIPLYQLSHKLNRTNELLEHIANQMAAATSTTPARRSLEEIAAARASMERTTR